MSIVDTQNDISILVQYYGCSYILCSYAIVLCFLLITYNNYDVMTMTASCYYSYSYRGGFPVILSSIISIISSSIIILVSRMMNQNHHPHDHTSLLLLFIQLHFTLFPSCQFHELYDLNHGTVLTHKNPSIECLLRFTVFRAYLRYVQLVLRTTNSTNYVNELKLFTQTTRLIIGRRN